MSCAIVRVDFRAPFLFPVDSTRDPRGTNADQIMRVDEENNGPIHVEGHVLRFRWRGVWIGVALEHCVIRYRGTPEPAIPPPKKGRPAKARDAGDAQTE